MRKILSPIHSSKDISRQSSKSNKGQDNQRNPPKHIRKYNRMANNLNKATREESSRITEKLDADEDEDEPCQRKEDQARYYYRCRWIDTPG